VGIDLLYVSPHPDDAVFSAGGAIALEVRAGRRVAVATVFSRGEDPGASAARRREDEAAIARLGAERIDLDLAEAPVRSRTRRRARLFAPLDRAELDLAAAVRERLRGIAAGAEVVAPLGVGRHADHQVVHAACAGLDGPTSFYEDLPYGLAPHLAARRVADLAGLRLGGVAGRLLALARWWAARPILRASGLLRPLAALAVAWRQIGAQPPASPLAVERTWRRAEGG
jgi:LmbE family N-acetylglucosaminyl deacetylase